MSAYDIGDQIESQVTFATAAGTATDPTAITAQWSIDRGAVTTLTYGVDAGLTKISTGVYEINLTTTEEGKITVRWAGTGTVIAASEDQFDVRGSKL